MAFMGVDPVLRFPNGVHDRTLGALVAGDLNYKANYEGAVFAFASETTLAMFEKNPAHYIPEVGGYCLGAMSQRRITPGDPRNFFFVPEEDGGGMWAVFGSPNGPATWSAMTTQERKERLAEAHAYYNARIGIVPIKPDGS